MRFSLIAILGAINQSRLKAEDSQEYIRRLRKVLLASGLVTSHVLNNHEKEFHKFFLDIQEKEGEKMVSFDAYLKGLKKNNYLN